MSAEQIKQGDPITAEWGSSIASRLSSSQVRPWSLTGNSARLSRQMPQASPLDDTIPLWNTNASNHLPKYGVAVLTRAGGANYAAFTGVGDAYAHIPIVVVNVGGEIGGDGPTGVTGTGVGSMAIMRPVIVRFLSTINITTIPINSRVGPIVDEPYLFSDTTGGFRFLGVHDDTEKLGWVIRRHEPYIVKGTLSQPMEPDYAWMEGASIETVSDLQSYWESLEWQAYGLDASATNAFSDTGTTGAVCYSMSMFVQGISSWTQAVLNVGCNDGTIP